VLIPGGMIMKAASSACDEVGPKDSSGRKHSTQDSAVQTAQVKILYRASHPIMVLAFRDNHHAAVAVRPGDIFEVIGLAQDDRFVIVSIKGQEFLVFESDIRTRGEILSPGVVQTPKESPRTLAPAESVDTGNQGRS
jgi:hypothetical protein